MPVVSIRHVTTYRYRKPVGFGEHRMLLRPLDTFDQRLLSAELLISPEPSLLRPLHAVSDACLQVARFDQPSERLVVESLAVVDHRPHADFACEAQWRPAAGSPYAPGEAEELAGSIRRRCPDAGEVAAWASRFAPDAGAACASEVMIAMMQAIHGEFAYALRVKGPPQSPQQTLALRQGSCRDFALLMIEAARSLGLAARFVTGYIYSAATKTHTGGGHTHAWARVFLPGCGWTDFDPTNGIVGNHDLIRVAVVADPRLALPLHGSWDGEAADFLGMDVSVALKVEPEMQRNSRLRVAASN
jgi:transglutaminase-like putative cysteine protease